MARRKGSITSTQSETLYFPTGITIMDFIMSLNIEPTRMGFPTGSSLEIYAPPSRGKSVLAAVIGRNALRKFVNANIVYINAEAESLHPQFITNVLGIDLDRFYSIDTPILKEITPKLSELLIKEGFQDKPTVIVWDSLAEIKALDSWDDAFDLSDSSLSAHIKKKMKFVSNILSISSMKPIFHIFTNQVRSNFKNTGFGHVKEYKTLDSPGGWQVKHLVPYRIFVGSLALKEKDSIIIGDDHISSRGFSGKFVIIKHRYYGQWQFFEIPFFFDFQTGSYNSMFTTMRIVEKYAKSFEPIIKRDGRKYILSNGLSYYYKDLIAYFKEDPVAWNNFEQQVVTILYQLSANPQNIYQLSNTNMFDSESISNENNNLTVREVILDEQE